jgi:hypothetical protein
MTRFRQAFRDGALIRTAGKDPRSRRWNGRGARRLALMNLSIAVIGLSLRFGADAWVSWDEQSFHGCIRPQLRRVVESVLPSRARRKLLGFPGAGGGSFFQMCRRKKDHLLFISHQLSFFAGAFSFGRPAAFRKDQAAGIGRIS